MQGNSEEAGGAPAGGSDPGDPHAHRVASYEKAAELATQAHPLPGEDVHTPHLDDAQMWHRVYTELLEFKETLIRDTNKALQTIAPVAREEVERTDAVILAAERERFVQRLALWRERCAELSGER